MASSAFTSTSSLPPLGNPSQPPQQVILQVQKTLGALSADQLDRIFSVAEELDEEDGAYLGPREAPRQEGRSEGGFDLMPLVVGGEEWSQIEAGLTQRVRAWNLFLRDIYSGQEILKAGVVPYEIIYADPNFHRGCARLPGVTASYLQLTAFDLQQDSRGQWLVVEDHLGIAEGASYALKKRQVLRQIMPRLFDGMEILPIEDFAAQVLDVLQELVRIPEGTARSVLLAQGSSDHHYLDHAALARQMGVSIVQGSDLVVLDSRLYLKTIAGVEPVDVVLRRLSTSLLDPVIFDPASRFGVPGLLSCVRKGTLAVANGLGSDLANNRAPRGASPGHHRILHGRKAAAPLADRSGNARHRCPRGSGRRPRRLRGASRLEARAGPRMGGAAHAGAGLEPALAGHRGRAERICGAKAPEPIDAELLDGGRHARSAGDAAGLRARPGPDFALRAGLDRLGHADDDFGGADDGPDQGCLDFTRHVRCRRSRSTRRRRRRPSGSG